MERGRGRRMISCEEADDAGQQVICRGLWRWHVRQKMTSCRKAEG